MRTPPSVAAAALLMMGLTAPLAQATSMVRLTQDQLVDAADVIVRGTVIEVWTEFDASGHVWTHAQVDVARVLKGDPALGALVIEQPGGDWAGRVTTVDGAARFSVGEDAYFFVENLDSGRSVTVGMFQGKFNVVMDPYARENIVHRYAVHPNQPFDHRFLPLPDAEQRISTLDFEDTILARVADGWDGQPIPGIRPETLRLRSPGVK